MESEQALNETQSLQVIREMIKVSHKKLRYDGILFIVWGWLMMVHYCLLYIAQTRAMTYSLNRVVKITLFILPLAGILFSLIYLYTHRKKVQTYIGTSLRWVWFSLFVCLSLTNMILFHGLGELNLKLQHPLFMLFIAFATVVTGGIIRFRLVIIGGIIFGALAFISSRFELPPQLILEAAGWLIAFIIPGHILYAARKK